MLKISWDLSHNLVQAQGASHLFVLVKITAPRVEEKKRTPLNLALVLDRSGSMAGDKLKFAIHAAKFLVSQLSPQDFFSVVKFDDQVNTIYPAQHITNKDNLKQIIDGIVEGGSTNLSGGWLAGSQEILKNLGGKQVNRIILLTDGQANQGITAKPELVKIAAELAAKNVSTSAIGFGKDFDENLLMGIGEAGRGNFHYIDSPEKAPRVFSEELSELLTLFAQNLVMTISPSEQVSYTGVHHDYPVSVNNKGEAKIELGDIYSADEKVVLLEFIMPAAKAGKKVGVSVLTLSYQQIYKKLRFHEVSAFVKVGYGHTEEVAQQKINPVVQRELLLCDASTGRKDAVTKADSGDFEAARKRLNELIEGIMKSDFSDEAIFQEEVKKLKHLLTNFDTRESYLATGRKEAYYGSVVLSKRKGSYSSISLSSIFPLEMIESLKNAASVVLITGAGLSAEIGVPGMDEGLPGREKMADIFTYESFERRPSEVWDYIAGLRSLINGLNPGPGFEAIARMEDYWKDFCIITKSIDGLHKRAGNRNVVEIFGNIFNARCIAERKVIEAHTINTGGEEKCPCGSYLRPDILLGGEQLSQEAIDRIKDIIIAAKVIFLLGTTFSQALQLVAMAKQQGAVIFEINALDTTGSGLADFHLGKVAKAVLPLLWKDVLR